EEDLVALLVGLLDTPLRQFLLCHRLGDFDALRGEVGKVLHFLSILVVCPDALCPPQGLVCILQGHRGLSRHLGRLLRLRIGGTGVLQRHWGAASRTAASQQAASHHEASKVPYPSVCRLVLCIVLSP